MFVYILKSQHSSLSQALTTTSVFILRISMVINFLYCNVNFLVNAKKVQGYQLKKKTSIDTN